MRQPARQLSRYLCKNPASTNATLTRRNWLRASGAIAFGSVLLTSCSRQQTTTLSMMLDTLLPEDDFAGALTLGYDTRLQQQLKTNPGKYGYLPRLVDDIDQLSKKHHKQTFAMLKQAQREALLTQELEHGADVIKQPLNKLRALIFNWYYGSQEGQRSLGYLAPAFYAVSR